MLFSLSLSLAMYVYTPMNWLFHIYIYSIFRYRPTYIQYLLQPGKIVRRLLNSPVVFLLVNSLSHLPYVCVYIFANNNREQGQMGVRIGLGRRRTARRLAAETPLNFFRMYWIHTWMCSPGLCILIIAHWYYRVNIPSELGGRRQSRPQNLFAMEGNKHQQKKKKKKKN